MEECKDRPCKQCPFVKGSAPGWLGEWDGPEELHGFVMSENSFPCHMTQNTEDPNLSVMCTGAILYLNKNAKRAFQNHEVRDAQHRMKGTSTENIMNLREFHEYHNILKGGRGW